MISFWKLAFAERIRSKASLIFKAILVIAVFVGYQYLPALVDQLGLGTRLVTIIVYYFAITTGMSIVRIIVIRRYLSRNKLAADHVDNFTIALKRISAVTAHFIFFFVLLSILGIAIGQFFTSISIFAAAIVIMGKEYFSNFFSGLVMIFTDRFRINDYVKVAEYKGRIKDVTFQTTELRTTTGEVVYIPNTSMLHKEVANLSKSRSKTISEEYILGLLTPKQRDELEKQIKEAFSGSKYSPSVSVVKVDKDSCTVKVDVKISQYSFPVEQDIRRDVIETILRFRSKQLKTK